MVKKALKKLSKNELVDEVLSLHEEVEYWQSIAKQFQQAAYAPKSESSKYIDDVTQPLFNFKENESESAQEEPSEETAKKDTLDSVKKKKRNTQPKDYSHLPHRELIITVPDHLRMCDHCGKEKYLLRYEEREILNRKVILEVIVQKREVLACCSQSDNPIVTAPVPERILPFVGVTDEFIAWVITSKVIDRLTLYQLEQQLRDRYKCPISRQTMARWLIQSADALEPLYKLLKTHLKSYDVMWVDATHFQVLKEKNKKAQSKSYCYCAKGGPPGQPAVLFEYSKNHHQFLKPFLSGWKGYLHADAHLAYDYLKGIPDIILVLCNVHSRRKYKEIVTTMKKKKIGVAKDILKLYKAIYKEEALIKEQGVSAERRAELREEKIRPHMNEIESIVETKLPVASKSTRIYEALKYTHKHKKGLTAFFEDGRLELDNNFCEQMIKYFALSRNSFLFADTVAGAKALAKHFTLLYTAQLNGLEPLDYYVKLFEQLPKIDINNQDELKKLLPWNIKRK